MLILPKGLKGVRLAEGGNALRLTWTRQADPHHDSVEHASVLRMRAKRVMAGGNVFVVEGVCCVTEGLGQTAEKSNCIVVHVTAHAEPPRVVLLPVR